MRIRRNQSQPVPSDRFNNKINSIYNVFPRCSCSYYGKHVKEIEFYDDFGDDVYEFGGSYIGTIINYIENFKKSESIVLDEKELLGVKRNFSINVYGTEVTATTTSLIHPNGKVSFFYDNIPTEIEESKLQSEIYGLIRCDYGNAQHVIPVPAKWIKSGTLVEFEAIGEICSQYNTSETCKNATSSRTTCIWCGKGKKCIESKNQDTHGLKVNDCRVEKNSDVNDLSTSTPIKDIETTLRSTEVQKNSDVNDLSTSTPIKDIETTLRSTEVQNVFTRSTEEYRQHF